MAMLDELINEIGNGQAYVADYIKEATIMSDKQDRVLFARHVTGINYYPQSHGWTTIAVEIVVRRSEGEHQTAEEHAELIKKELTTMQTNTIKNIIVSNPPISRPIAGDQRAYVTMIAQISFIEPIN